MLLLSGKETAMPFVTDKISSVTTPLGLLKGFEKVDLQPGEEKSITIFVPYKELGLWNANMDYVVESGEFVIKVGRSWNDLRQEKTIKVLQQ